MSDGSITTHRKMVALRPFRWRKTKSQQHHGAVVTKSFGKDCHKHDRSSTDSVLVPIPMPPTPTISPARIWMSSFYRLDPRWLVHEYFRSVSLHHQQSQQREQQQQRRQKQLIHERKTSPESAIKLVDTAEQPPVSPPPPLSSVFTIWRPTSADAIRRMMSGEATGKGLEIKGKSARAGNLSAYVPFLQIHEESDKAKIRTIPRSSRVRIFYSSRQARDAVLLELEPFQDQMANAVQDAKRIVKKSVLSVASTVVGASSDLAETGKDTVGNVAGLVVGDTTGVVDADAAVSSAKKHAGAFASAVECAISAMNTTGNTYTDPSTTSPASNFAGDAAAAVAATERTGSLTTGAGVDSAPKNRKSFRATLQRRFSVKKLGGRTLPRRRSCTGDLKTEKESPNNDFPNLRKTMQRRASLKDVFQRRIPAKGAVGVSGETSQRRGSNSISAVEGPGEDESERTEWALKRLLWDMDDPSIKSIETYTDQYFYGVELPGRLLWRAFVADRDISRPKGSKHFTNRPSQPAFQDMNFIAIHKTRKHRTKFKFKSKKEKEANNACVVLWHAGGLYDDPMDPRGLVMAYEEDSRILPVVSDFDCFTMGTRGVAYDQPLPEDQKRLLQWCVSEIEDVLAKQKAQATPPHSTSQSWSLRWLDVLKRNAARGFHPEIPQFGFGDATSYSIIESAVSWLKQNGAVRHGSECFNYFFPQELDATFLIVESDRPRGKVPWRYVGVKELQSFLLQKVDQGFTFPLNPKWILCDDGWKDIYDRLMASDQPNVQESLNVWFPCTTRIRQDMESIAARYPQGFECDTPVDGEHVMTGTEAMDLATMELRQFRNVRRARIKIRTVIAFTLLLKEVRAKIAERNTDEGDEDTATVLEDGNDDGVNDGIDTDYSGKASYYFI